MAEFSYDNRSFILDGKRVWIYDGEIHYYRFPKAEWRRALTIAKAAGLNCVSTYVAWNYHEPEEGRWDFSGDRDFGAFLDIAAELGLYVMVRPGPYICAEWNGGGIPSWLLPKKGMLQRTNDREFMAHTRIWLKKLMEIVVPRQITHGGTVIAVQNDNEYHGGWDQATTDYVKNIYATLREAGVDVAVTACNCHADANGNYLINYGAKLVDRHMYDDMIVTFNTCAPRNVVPQLRAFEPDKPIITTELWTGPMVFWGKPVQGGMKDSDVAKWIAEFTAQRVQICMYMFIGGTNHGFNGASNLATSYASAYPVGDGLRPRSKYYVIKPIGAFAAAFGPQLAMCDETLFEKEDGTIRRQEGENGAFLFAEGNGRFMTLTAGNETFEVRLPECGIGVYPDNLVFDGHTVNRSTMQLLSQKNGTLYLYGDAGADETLVIDGQRYNITIPARRPVAVDGAPVRAVVMDVWLAEHFWVLKDEIVMGGSLAYDSANGTVIEGIAEEKHVYTDKAGTITVQTVAEKVFDSPLPVLKSWQVDRAMDSIRFEKLDAPVYHENLGVYNGYLWYKGKVTCGHDGSYRLMAACFNNRILVFANGRYFGVLGEERVGNERMYFEKPEKDVLDPVTVDLKRGENEIILLSEDTGHSACDSKPMGPMGPVYGDVRRYYPDKTVYLGKKPISDAAAEYLYSADLIEKVDLDTMEFTVPCAEDEDLFIVLSGVKCFMSFNGEDGDPIHILDKPFNSFGGATGFYTFQPQGGTKGKTRVTVNFFGSAEQVMAHAQIYIAKKASLLTDWHWSRFDEMPVFEGRADLAAAGRKSDGNLVPYSEVSQTAADHIPTWYTTRFDRPEGDAFAFVPGGSQKGQLYLNGHNAGRINGVITQSFYYLPASWFKDVNTLSVFDEFGNAPIGAELIRL